MDVEVTQGEGGKGAGGENNVRWDRASVVCAPFGAIGVDYRKASCGGVEETIRGEEVKCHEVPSLKKPRKERNRRQKGTINIKGNPGLAAAGRGGGKNRKRIKGGEFAPVYRRVLKGYNGRRVGQLCKEIGGFFILFFIFFIFYNHVFVD